MLCKIGARDGEKSYFTRKESHLKTDTKPLKLLNIFFSA